MSPPKTRAGCADGRHGSAFGGNDDAAATSLLRRHRRLHGGGHRPLDPRSSGGAASRTSSGYETAASQRSVRRVTAGDCGNDHHRVTHPGGSHPSTCETEPAQTWRNDARQKHVSVRSKHRPATVGRRARARPRSRRAVASRGEVGAGGRSRRTVWSPASARQAASRLRSPRVGDDAADARARLTRRRTRSHQSRPMGGGSVIAEKPCADQRRLGQRVWRAASDSCSPTGCAPSSAPPTRSSPPGGATSPGSTSIRRRRPWCSRST